MGQNIKGSVEGKFHSARQGEIPPLPSTLLHTGSPCTCSCAPAAPGCSSALVHLLGHQCLSCLVQGLPATTSFKNLSGSGCRSELLCSFYTDTYGPWPPSQSTPTSLPQLTGGTGKRLRSWQPGTCRQHTGGC